MAVFCKISNKIADKVSPGPVTRLTHPIDFGRHKSEALILHKEIAHSNLSIIRSMANVTTVGHVELFLAHLIF